MSLLLICRLLPPLAVKLAQKHGDGLRELGRQAVDDRGVWNPGVYLQLDKGKMFGAIPSQPRPLVSMLAGGLAGAGLGYGIGALGEGLLPATWNRKKLRRTLGIAGGLAGISPGLAWGLANLLAKRKFNDPHFAEGPRPFSHQPWMDYPLEKAPPLEDGTQQAELVDKLFKSAAESALADMTGLSAAPVIDVNQWNQMIWQDPRVAIPLTPLQQVAASGLVTGASHMPGKVNTKLVTPWDIARMAAGMGSGYASGMLVGKALGTLVGLPEQAQEKLKTTGTYAGLIANLVPLVFGG